MPLVTQRSVDWATRRLPRLLSLLLVVSVLSGCAGATSTGTPSHREATTTVPSGSSQYKKSATSQEERSSSPEAALGNGPVKSCAVVSLAEVRKIAPGAVSASECLYNRVTDAGTALNTLVVELVPPAGSQESREAL